MIPAVTVVGLAALEDRLYLVGGVLLLGVVAAIVARRLSVPVLILFLGLGMLLGSEGIGGIYFDDAELARTIGVLGGSSSHDEIEQLFERWAAGPLPQ